MGLSLKSDYRKNCVSCFDIRKVPRSPGKWNWNLLNFLPFIFTFEQREIDKGGLPFCIFRGVHGVVQSLMLSNGQKRNLSSFRQRWWSVKNWFVQNKRTCIACYFLFFTVIFCKEKKIRQKNMILIENLQNQISQGQIVLHTVM